MLPQRLIILYSNFFFACTLFLGACTDANRIEVTQTTTSKSAAVTLARPGYKLVEFCDAAYVLEVPQTANTYHKPDECVLEITLPNHTPLVVRLVEKERLSDEFVDAKIWLQNPRSSPAQKININGIDFERNEITGMSSKNEPATGCVMVSTDDAVMKGYRIVMTFGPETGPAYS